MRAIWIAVAIWVLGQTGAAAATVAAYYANAFGAITLTSARTAGGNDAAAFLEPGSLTDTNSFVEGSADPNRYFRSTTYADDAALSHGGAIGGSATGSDGAAASLFETYITYQFIYHDEAYCAFENPGSPFCPERDPGPLELVFDYYLETAATASIFGPPAGAHASAAAAVQICYATGRPCAEPRLRSTATATASEGDPSAMDTDTDAGSFSLFLDRGESAFVDIFVFSAEGSANVSALSPAPVPLPAGLPMLAGALGGLAVAARRRGKMHATRA